MLYAYCPLMNGMSPKALFRSVGLVPHADVHLRWLPLSLRLAKGAVLVLILKRRKKLFDVIACPDPRWGRVVKRLRWLHHAEIVSQDDESQLLSVLQSRSGMLPRAG